MDEVFKALADPTRRALLDALFERDGQTVQALCDRFPAMTRFGVMKHLGVLETANLVTTRRDGKAIYFLSTRSGSSQVWKLPLEGGEAQHLAVLQLGGERLLLAEGLVSCAHGSGGYSSHAGAELAALMQPRAVHWCDGSEAERLSLTAEAVKPSPTVSEN